MTVTHKQWHYNALLMNNYQWKLLEVIKKADFTTPLAQHHQPHRWHLPWLLKKLLSWFFLIHMFFPFFCFLFTRFMSLWGGGGGLTLPLTGTKILYSKATFLTSWCVNRNAKWQKQPNGKHQKLTAISTPSHSIPVCVEKVSLFFAPLSPTSRMRHFTVITHGLAEQNCDSSTWERKHVTLSVKKKKSWFNGPLDGDFHWSAGPFTGHEPVD